MTPSPYPVPFKSAHLRANIVKVLLIIGAIAAAISLITDSLSIAFPPITENEELGDNPAGFAIALVIFLLGVFELIVYVTTVVFFAVWLYRAYDNLRVFNRTGLDYSPSLAVGSFFIPFANLVIPYRAVREVWQKSGVPEETMLGLTDPPARFPIWWMFWILASFAGNISMRVSLNDNVPHTTAAIVSIGASALFLLAAVFAFLVVDAIDRRQEDTAEKLQLGGFARPQPPPANLGAPVMNESSFSGQ